MTDIRQLFFVNAYQVYLGTLHGSCGSPMTHALFEALRSPRPGDLVMETTTLGMPERDDHRFGRLLRKVYEPVCTREEWTRDGGAPDEAIPAHETWYIETPSGAESRWENASFIRVLEAPAHSLSELHRPLLKGASPLTAKG